jgi:hypothetical protein
MRVLFINNAGAGFADHVEVEPAVTIEQFFTRQMGKESAPADYLIRVNRLPAARDQVLQENDRISVTPTKVAGA